MFHDAMKHYQKETDTFILPHTFTVRSFGRFKNTSLRMLQDRALASLLLSSTYIISRKGVPELHLQKGPGFIFDPAELVDNYSQIKEATRRIVRIKVLLLTMIDF